MAISSFEVCGSYGTITAEVTSGKVIACVHDSVELAYDDIVRFDIKEYEMQFQCKLLAGDALGLLDIGFWTTSGKYFEALGNNNWPKPLRIAQQLST